MFKDIDLEWDEKLEDALNFLHINLKPREIMVFAWFGGVAVLAATFFFTMVAMLMGVNPLYILFTGFIAAIGAIFFIPDYPVRMVNYERIRCLSYAPRLVAYMIIPLKQDPNIEKAVKFAAECGDDKLSLDLKQLLWHTWSGKHNSVDDALPELGLRWGTHIKGFRDALYAIRSSQLEKHETRRLDTLDRALRELLSNIQAEFKDFTNDLRVPTSFLFMGGVLFPMVALMFLPVLSMMGMEIGAPVYVIIGLSIIVVAVFVVAEFILSKRPIAFSSIKVPDNYPGLVSPGKFKMGNREAPIASVALFVAGLISVASIPFLIGYKMEIFNQLNTLPIVIGVFAGFYTYFKLDSSERLKARNEIARAEEEAIEASFHIGNRLMSAMPAEEAIIRVSELLKVQDKNSKNVSKLSAILENTVKNIRYMNLPLKDAFFDPDRGSLKDVHSGLITGIFRLFVNSMERGVDAAAETLINSANHFREIRKVEADLREKMSYMTSMMKVSVTYVAPALCGMAIPLTEVFIKMLSNMQKGSDIFSVSVMGGSLLKTPELTPPILTLVLGGYMLALILVLVRFTAILENGEDKVMMKNELSKAFPRAIITFVATLFISRMFFATMA
jgi:hypothetical protein